MIIYKDVISGDEMISDAYDIKEVDDTIFEVDCQMITVKAGEDVDIGANPSAEDADDALEEGSSSVNNVVYSFRLQETSFDKKSFMVYIKGYMKKVKAYLSENNPDAVGAFEKGATTAVKKIIANFKDYEFFTGESMDPEGMVVLMNYRDDGMTPYMVFWKHGLKGEKF